MEGLAQQMAGAPAQQQAPQVDAQMIEQIIQLLMQGVDPEELVKQGIPPEVIMQAIEILEQQMAAQGQQQAPAQQLQPAPAQAQAAQQGPPGLAQSMMG